MKYKRRKCNWSNLVSCGTGLNLRNILVQTDKWKFDQLGKVDCIVYHITQHRLKISGRNRWSRNLLMFTATELRLTGLTKKNWIKTWVHLCWMISFSPTLPSLYPSSVVFPGCSCSTQIIKIHYIKPCLGRFKKMKKMDGFIYLGWLAGVSGGPKIQNTNIIRPV